MIRYSLSCAEGHRFDSWFQSAAAYDTLAAAGRLSCAVCGGARVEKALMAPVVVPADKAARAPERKTDARADARTDAPARPLSAPASEAEAAMAALRRHVEETSDYVGMNFAAEARAIHGGTAPDRPIHGEARIDEARKLIEEGVPVAPLPFLPARRVN